MDCCHPTPAAGEAPLTLALLFVSGFTLSFGHCLGMCGPILSAYSMSQRQAGSNRPPILALLRYHAGRICSYGVIGALFALFGTASTAADPTLRLQSLLSLAVGVAMALLALGLLGVLPTQRWVEASLPGRWVTRTMARLLRSRSIAGQIGLGCANGFLPCGPVIAVGLAAAAARHPWSGMLAMFAYGLGTVPALMALGLGAGAVGAETRARVFRIGAVVLVLVAAQLILRGLAAWGLVPHLHWRDVVLY